MSETAEILKNYMPGEAAPLIARWINHYQVTIKVSRGRRTKLGDYRHPFGVQGHRISINYNLNPYAFLITLVHEFGHLLTYNRYKNRVKPHGTEWKLAFRELMDPFLDMQVFPIELQNQLKGYLDNPAASSCSDLNLMRILERYDQVHPDQLNIESIVHGELFYTADGRCFRKGEKLRKRFKCQELKTKRFYLFNPLAKVKAA